MMFVQGAYAHTGYRIDRRCSIGHCRLRHMAVFRCRSLCRLGGGGGVRRFHAHDGGASSAFDNARRDVVTELEHVGFRKENIRQYSAWARYFARDASGETNAETFGKLLQNAVQNAPDGCLVYFSTHGTPYGIVFGDEILRPSQLRD